MYFLDRLPSKKRSLLVTGPSDSGKSFFGALVRRQLPRARVFLPLTATEFCWTNLDETHLLGFSNDWRFSPKLPVQPCLNWLEGLEFAYNRKHERPGESKGPPAIFTSNDVENGWSKVDIAAFFARMGAAIHCHTKLIDAGVAENEANKRVEKCLKCGACALIWKSPILAQKVQCQYPASYRELCRHINSFLAKRNRSQPQTQGGSSASKEMLSEYDALVREAGNT